MYHLITFPQIFIVKFGSTQIYAAFRNHTTRERHSVFQSLLPASLIKRSSTCTEIEYLPPMNDKGAPHESVSGLSYDFLLTIPQENYAQRPTSDYGPVIRSIAHDLCYLLINILSLAHHHKFSSLRGFSEHHLWLPHPRDGSFIHKLCAFCLLPLNTLFSHKGRNGFHFCTKSMSHTLPLLNDFELKICLFV